MIADLLLIIIGLVWLLAATIQDIRKREVANWISFSLIVVALAIRAAYSIIYNDIFYFIYGLAGFLVFLGVANLLYYGKIFAGGDAKLLMGLGVIFATKPYFVNTSSIFGLPFAAIFIINIFVVGSVYGILYSMFLGLKNIKRLKKEVKKTMKKTKKLRLNLILTALLFLALYFVLKEKTLFVLTILIVIFPYLYVFVKSVEEVAMVYPVKTSKLTEGDWLVSSIKIGKKTILPKWEGLTMAEIKLLKKYKKEVIIKQGIPFVPVFFFAAIATLLGNLLEIVINLIR